MRMVGLNHLKLRSLSNSRSWEKKTTMPWWRWRGYALANLFYLACAQFDELLDMNEAKTFLSTAAFDTWYSDLKDLVEPESKLYRPDFDGKQDLDDKQVLIDKQVLDDRQILVENLASSINKVVSDLKMLAAKQVMIEKIVVDINKFIDDEVLSNKQGLVQMLRDTIKDTLDTKQVFDDKQIFDDQRGLIEQLVSSIKTVLDVDRFFDNKQLLVQQLILAIKKVLADKQVLAGSQVFTDKQALSDEQGLVHKLISTFKQVLADKKVLNDEQVLAERHALVKELLLGVKEGMTAKKVSDDTHVYTDKLVFASMGTILPLSNGESRIPEVIAFAVQSEEMHALGSRLEDIYLDRLIQVSEADKIWEEMGLINYIKSLGTGDYANIAITKLLIKLNEKGGTSLVDDSPMLPCISTTYTHQ
ncbi:uncharacterized protein PHALS_03144 [Plasmopara halstedii]|uniref:Uncharacterized protein n=1 Tax=Plasmopara halstedii TaxID=4781 RepID=A0A0P1A7T9_PLAHL|nr:uncharacterized protein PHALS_03144 [Plasmopara halstedii]CEG36599.1 hypothetical protein PHALS_03144 [Plasmopara halstedii]|eukprot:XP_024572968.1 hypothetical protein PHALS_03144 [Plasmopara halstedii]